MTFQTAVLPKLNTNKFFWITVGVVVWLCYVVINLPAVWGAYAVTHSGSVAMNGVSGTLWSGRASLASIKVRGADHSLGELTWKLNVLSLFTFKPCAFITTQMDGQEFEGNVCIKNKTAFGFKNISTTFPATLIQPLLPLPIDGQFSLNLERLDIADGKLLDLNGKATWLAGKIYNGSNWMAFGTLGADLKDDGKNGLTANIIDVNSPMRIALVGNLPYPTGASIKGTLALPEAYFREINAGAWLSMFASPEANDAKGNLVYSVNLKF